MEAIIYIGHAGKGIPYVAVRRQEGNKNDPKWRSFKGEAFPGLEPYGSGETGDWLVAEADQVGVIPNRLPGCFGAKFGPAGLSAEEGHPRFVQISI